MEQFVAVRQQRAQLPANLPSVRGSTFPDVTIRVLRQFLACFNNHS